jgi:hypothetical protein
MRTPLETLSSGGSGSTIGLNEKHLLGTSSR